MRNWTGKRHAAGTVLAAILLTLTAACGSAPRKSLQQPLQQQQLSQWSGPQDCTTEYTAATSGLEPTTGGTPALLVDSVGTVWNCMAIPEGRYDVEVIARWSNGFQETTLLKNIQIAPGQTLVAMAYQHAKGPISATIADVRVHSEPVQPPTQTVTAGSPAESLTSTPDSPSTDAARASSAESTSESPHPAWQVAKVVAAVVVITALVVLTHGSILNHMGTGGGQSHSATPSRPKQTNWSSRPSNECCFVWIEDGVTSEVVAGKRPIRN